MLSEPNAAAHSLLKTFAEERLIGIVRTDSAESALWTSIQLLEVGVRLIEIPLTVPDAVQVMETLTEQYPQAIIGAGTVLEARQAIHSLAAGAQFLVAPVLLEPLIQLGREQNILVLPGCMTPTEIYTAHTLGAAAVKFFPASAAGGPEFLKSLKGPLPHIPIVPTGGIELDDVAEYLNAGALAVGVGGPLIPKRFIEARDAAGLKAHSQSYLDAARNAKATAHV